MLKGSAPELLPRGMWATAGAGRRSHAPFLGRAPVVMSVTKVVVLLTNCLRHNHQMACTTLGVCVGEACAHRWRGSHRHQAPGIDRQTTSAGQAKPHL